MTARRRWPRAKPAAVSTHVPAPSGPRCCSVAAIARTRRSSSRSALVAPEKSRDAAHPGLAEADRRLNTGRIRGQGAAHRRVEQHHQRPLRVAAGVPGLASSTEPGYLAVLLLTPAPQRCAFRRNIMKCQVVCSSRRQDPAKSYSFVLRQSVRSHVVPAEGHCASPLGESQAIGVSEQMRGQPQASDRCAGKKATGADPRKEQSCGTNLTFRSPDGAAIAAGSLRSEALAHRWGRELNV